MQQMRKMEVGDLSGKTLNFVSHSLDKPTLNSWEDLMRSQTFRSIYSTDDIEKIRLKSGRVSPAVALIQDLVCRKTPLEDLMSGLREIENKEAILIIENGKPSLMSFLETMSNSLSPQDSGGRPPPSLFIPRQPEENGSSVSLSYARCASSVKTQGETYPVQESAGIKEDHPCDPYRLQENTGKIFSYFFPCLGWFGRPKDYSNI
ncbi:unnamed protein product [Porites evermanni]|uniref:Uncharacterized protein n=1 Tax=Porites evermanni TaxID=104178 RepID=A0ABN8PLJ5_9CNID|nr:unnamed protein product [Porites evermanni]